MIPNGIHRAALATALAGIAGLSTSFAAAQPFIGEITAFAGPSCPRGWTAASGQLVHASELRALYSLIGTTYGGNGNPDFAVPNLNGRHVSGAGSGGGLPPRQMAETYGSATVTLQPANLPAHRHPFHGSAAMASERSVDGAVPASFPAGTSAFAPDGNVTEVMAADSVTATGQGTPVDIRQPYAAVTWCIAVDGLYPERN